MKQMKVLTRNIRFFAFPLFITMIVSLLPMVSAQAETAEEKGLAIAKERKVRDLNWGDTVAKMSMVLRNAAGDEVERKIRVKSLEVKTDGDKALTIFDQPLDVKGTAFLSYSHAITDDEQWMYLPKLSKVKRIRSQNKSGPFMGSEFAFEDMNSFEIEKFKFKYLRDEIYEEQDCFVIEQVPTYENSGYSKQIVWVDKKSYRTLKVEFYDRKQSLLKELTNHDFELYLNKYWRPMRVEMYNEQNSKSTDLITHSIEFKTGLSDSDFNTGHLKNIR